MPPESTAHGAWMDDFFSSYYRHRPVNGTFVGVHDLDDRLPDLSENATGDALSEGRELLARSDALAAPATPAETVDRRLARGFLRIQEWELTSRHFHAGNPSLYTGEAVFGVVGLFLTAFAPVRDRVAAATARMSQVERLLAQARGNVRAAPASWTERAIRECHGAIALFTAGVDALIASGFEATEEDSTHGPPPRSSEIDAFRAGAEAAVAAFSEHLGWLESTLLRQTHEGYASGAEAFALHLRDGHQLDRAADEIARYAEAELAAAESRLASEASDLGGTTPAELLARLRAHHPEPGEYYGRFEEVWRDVRTRFETHGLLTWPDFPIRYVPRPPWTRAAAPHLYFLFYRSPAAYGRPAVHDYLVAPLPEGDPADFLRANNDSVIKLNHVIHHGGAGHHVQNWHAFRAESRIGRMAAVDCASRIAMLCGGTMAEGWACYATDLAGEFGALTPLERYAELHGRVRMAARAIVDVRLHHGGMTLDEAAAFYAERAGMSAEAARGEAVKNSMFPGAALMYLVGTDGIHELRAEVSRRQGAGFDLRTFHDAFLSHGSIPVSMIAEQMTESFERAE